MSSSSPSRAYVRFLCVRALVRSRSYLQTAHQRASSPPTDSPFRMSHRRASKHKHIGPRDEGQRPAEPINCSTTTTRLQLKCWHFFWRSNNEPCRQDHESCVGSEAVRLSARRGRNCSDFCSESQMCLQDVPRDWACNPSSPLLPSPFPSPG